MHGKLLLVAALAVLVAGCAESPAGSVAGEYRVSGAFTEDFNQTDFDRSMEGFDVNVAILESFPPQYIALTSDLGECERVRAALQEIAYVRSVGECQRVEPTEEGDEPVSSG